MVGLATPAIHLHCFYTSYIRVGGGQNTESKTKNIFIGVGGNAVEFSETSA